MIKVKLQFTLVGKSEAWKRHLPKHGLMDFVNADNLTYVKDTVADYFGNRALVVVNERFLTDDAVKYPPYYSAGWFTSDDCSHELVIIAHGESMADANKAMMDSIRTVNWEESAVRI